MAIHLSRRNFLKTASIAAASVPLSKVVAKAETGVAKAPLVPPGSFKDTDTVVGGVCEMCFWRCQLVGKVRDGRLVKIEGNPKSIGQWRLHLCPRECRRKAAIRSRPPEVPHEKCWQKGSSKVATHHLG